MGRKHRFDSPAPQNAYEAFVEGSVEREVSFEAELQSAEVARKLYDLRTEAGLTQRELAKHVGTTASVICKLEDADYDGHSMAMLRRIAHALGKRIEIRFVPLRREGP